MPRGYDAPVDLLDGLHRRAVRIDEVNDAPAAMVALVRRGHGVMVIVEPASLIDADRLADTASQYHGNLMVWQYRFADRPRLRRYAGAAAPMAQPPIEHEATAGEVDVAEAPQQSEAALDDLRTPEPGIDSPAARLVQQTSPSPLPFFGGSGLLDMAAAMDDADFALPLIADIDETVAPGGLDEEAEAAPQASSFEPGVPLLSPEELAMLMDDAGEEEDEGEGGMKGIGT